MFARSRLGWIIDWCAHSNHFACSGFTTNSMWRGFTTENVSVTDVGVSAGAGLPVFGRKYQ
jgi:hypothetical protein